MRRVLMSVAVTVALFTAGCTGESKPAAGEGPKPAHLAEFERAWLKEYAEKNHKRVNGVLLNATAEVKGDDILIHWTIDYDGPRPPLTILKPLYPDYRFSCAVQFIVPDQAKAQSVKLWAPRNQPYLGIAPPLKRDAYLTVERGRAGRGTVSVPLADVKELLLAKLTLDPADQPPRDLFVGLVHAPRERGFEYGLDAWTVEKGSDEALYSTPRWVAIKKWP